VPQRLSAVIDLRELAPPVAIGTEVAAAVTSPPVDEPAGEAGEADGEVGGAVDCRIKVSNVVQIAARAKCGNMVVQKTTKNSKQKGYGSLTGAELGGTTLPELDTVHPLGRPGIEVCTVELWRVVALGTQGQTLGAV